MTFDIMREQREEDVQAGLPQEMIRVAAKIFKVDQTRVCVDFSRVAGSSWYFYDQFKLMKEHLKDLNDATLQE